MSKLPCFVMLHACVDGARERIVVFCDGGARMSEASVHVHMLTFPMVGELVVTGSESHLC